MSGLALPDPEDRHVLAGRDTMVQCSLLRADRTIALSHVREVGFYLEANCPAMTATGIFTHYFFLGPNAANHRRKKAERRRSGDFFRPNAFILLATTVCITYFLWNNDIF